MIRLGFEIECVTPKDTQHPQSTLLAVKPEPGQAHRSKDDELSVEYYCSDHVQLMANPQGLVDVDAFRVAQAELIELLGLSRDFKYLLHVHVSDAESFLGAEHAACVLYNFLRLYCEQEQQLIDDGIIDEWEHADAPPIRMTLPDVPYFLQPLCICILKRRWSRNRAVNIVGRRTFFAGRRKRETRFNLKKCPARVEIRAMSLERGSFDLEAKMLVWADIMRRARTIANSYDIDPNRCADIQRQYNEDPTKIAGIRFMGVQLRQPASKSFNMKLRGGERLKRFFIGKGTEHQREWTEHINPIIDCRVVYTRERRGNMVTPKHYDFTNAYMPINILENKNQFCQISHDCLFSPHVYFGLNEAQKVDELVIVKPNNGSDGRGIRICRAFDLTAHDFVGRTVQTLLKDTALYDCRKFHLRAMFLYCPGRCAHFLWNGMIFATPIQYDASKPLTLNMHITNRSYHVEQGTRGMESPAFKDWSEHTQYLEGLCKAGEELFACLERHVRVSDAPFHYDIYGLDVMFLNDGSCKILEVNTYWTMYPDPTQVRMVTDAFKLLAGDASDVCNVFTYKK